MKTEMKKNPTTRLSLEDFKVKEITNKLEIEKIMGGLSAPPKITCTGGRTYYDFD